MRVPATVHLALAAVQVMFATMAVAGKAVFPYVDPLGVACGRVAGATAAFWAVLLLRRRREPLQGRGDLLSLALYGFLAVAVNQVLFLLGLARTLATNASVLVTTIPLFTTALAVVLGREALTARRRGGVLVGFLGAAVAAGLDRFDPGERLFVGNLLILTNALAYALFLVLSRDLLQRYSPLFVTAWIFLWGSLLVVPVGAAHLAAVLPRLPPRAWLLLAFIVAVPTVGAYFVSSWCLRRAPATVVAVYIYLQPVTAGTLAHLLLGERLSLRVALGAGLIFVGIYLAAAGRRGGAVAVGAPPQKGKNHGTATVVAAPTRSTRGRPALTKSRKK